MNGCESPNMGTGNGTLSSTMAESAFYHRVTSPALNKERKCCTPNYFIVHSFQYQLSPQEKEQKATGWCRTH